MIVRNHEGREIEVDRVSGGIEEPMIDAAYYVDTNEEVTEEDYDYVYNNYAMELSEQAFQNEVGRSEYYFED